MPKAIGQVLEWTSRNPSDELGSSLSSKCRVTLDQEEEDENRNSKGMFLPIDNTIDSKHCHCSSRFSFSQPLGGNGIQTYPIRALGSDPPGSGDQHKAALEAA